MNVHTRSLSNSLTCFVSLLRNRTPGFTECEEGALKCTFVYAYVLSMIYNEKALWDSNPCATFAMLLQMRAVGTGAKEGNNEIMMAMGFKPKTTNMFVYVSDT